MIEFIQVYLGSQGRLHSRALVCVFDICAGLPGSLSTQLDIDR